MISKKIREEFEKAYPMPFACDWNSMTEEYECMWPEHGGEPETEVPILEHNDRLKVWIKSRESQVIELPDRRDTLAGPTLYAQFREAIEAAGLKVKL